MALELGTKILVLFDNDEPDNWVTCEVNGHGYSYYEEYNACPQICTEIEDETIQYSTAYHLIFEKPNNWSGMIGEGCWFIPFEGELELRLFPEGCKSAEVVLDDGGLAHMLACAGLNIVGWKMQ